MKKKSLLALMLVLNIILLVALVGMVYSPSTAYAQAAGTAGNFLAVAAEVQSDRDALFVVDLATRNLHVLGYDRNSGQISYLSWRDLSRDFSGGRP